MGRKWSVVLDRLVIVLLAVILLVPPAALPFSDPVPQVFAQTNSPPTYLDTFGSQGTGSGQFGSNGPWGIDVDSSGNVWVMDYKNEHVHKFNSAGTPLAEFGSEGTANGEFKDKGPRDIVVDSNGNFWVTDTKAHKIKKFNSAGVYQQTVGGNGNSDGDFKEPSGIAIDSEGNIWVADTNNNRIQKFNSAGDHLLTFSSSGSGDSQVKKPNGIAIDSEDNVWVADTNNNRIQKFNSAGGHLLTVGGTSSGSGNTQFDKPRALAIDSFDNVWIADFKNDRIVAYDSSGNYLIKYGTKNSNTGFTNDGPRGIAFESGTSTFYVTDTKGNKIHKFQNNLLASISVPGVPTGLTATPGDTEVALSWTAPYSGGSPITDYLVEYRLTSGGWQTFADGVGTGTTTTVTGLTNDSEYEFRISAINALGIGPTSNIATAIPSTSTTITVQISQSSDDAEEHDPSHDSDVILTSSDMDLDDSDYVGLRFNGLDIPQGATISNAYVEFTSEEDESGLSTVTIYGHDVDNAPTFTSTTDNISSRISTDAIISWSIPEWFVDDVGANTQTPELKTIIQEIVNRVGWNSNNDRDSIVLIFNADNPGAEGDRDAYSYDQTPSKSAKLYITFSSQLTVPTEPRSVKAVPAAGQVALTWSAPSNTGGSPIIDYIVTVSDDDDGATFTPFADGTGTRLSTIVTSLTDGNAYQFRVAAESSAGTGPASIGTTVTAGVGTVDDTKDFESIAVNFWMGPKSGSIHPTVPTNSKTDAFECSEPQVFFIGTDNIVIFTDITIVRSSVADTATACAYTASLPHFSTYGVNAIDSKFAVGAAGLAVGATNVAIPPVITGLAMYSFGAPELNEDGQLVFSKTGSYQSLPEYSQTLPTTTLNVGERSQIAVRIFDYNGPQAIEHVGLYLNLHGVAYESEDSDTYIIYDKDEDFTLVDPHGLLSDVDVSLRIEDTLLWVIFDMTFEKEMDTSTINVNAWNAHRARAEIVAYEILRASDYIPELEQITGTSDAKSSTVDTNFYVVESAPENCELCASPYDITLNDNEIEWTNHDESIRTIISGDHISGFDGLFKSNFIFQDNSYSTTIEDTDYYTIYDILEEQYHSTMIVEVSGDPITDARLLENPTMSFNYYATKITSGSSAGLFAMDVSIPDTIRVFGTIYDVDTRQVVFLDVIAPDGTESNLKLSTNSEGDFSTIQNIPDTWVDGIYTVSFNIIEKHISSVYFKLDSGKILPMFTPSTSVVAAAEAIAVVTPELTLLYTASLGRDGNLLVAEGHVDSSFKRVVVSIENPDGTMDEFKVILNDKNKYSLPLIRSEWLSGEYTVSVFDEKVEFASEQFTISEEEETKSELELEFESAKKDKPITINNVHTEVILLADDYYEQLDDFTGESEFGSLSVTRPDTKIAQSTLSMSGTIDESILIIGGLVEITLTRPSGDIEELSTIVTKEGVFDTILVESWLTGDYIIQASYLGNTISELTFFIGDKTTSDATAISCPTSDCVSIESESEDEILSSPIMIVFTGDVENTDTSILLEFTIVRPDNTSFDLIGSLSTTGELESPIIHSEPWISGVYTVIVSYNGEQLSAASFRK